MKFMGIIFLILFFGCFCGAVVGVILDIQAISIWCAVSIFALVFFFIILDILIKKGKAKNTRKSGKSITAKITGATYAGRKEVNMGRTHTETVYFYPIFSEEDIFGNITEYQGINKITGEDLQKLARRETVKLIAYKNACVIDEDLSTMPNCGSVGYIGKNIVLSEEGWWKLKKTNIQENNKQKNQTHKIYKIALIFLSVISGLVLCGATAFIVFAIVSETYYLIAGGVVAILFVVFTDLKLLNKIVCVLLVDKKGKRAYAVSFDAQTVYYNSSDAGSSTNYVVDFSFYDSTGNLRNAKEYVIEEVYFRIKRIDKLPIKVYKKYGAINLDDIYLHE